MQNNLKNTIFDEDIKIYRQILIESLDSIYLNNKTEYLRISSYQHLNEIILEMLKRTKNNIYNFIQNSEEWINIDLYNINNNIKINKINKKNNIIKDFIIFDENNFIYKLKDNPQKVKYFVGFNTVYDKKENLSKKLVGTFNKLLEIN